MAAAAIYSVMTGDIHDYKMRVESVLRTLGGENFPEEDEASIRSFVEHLRVKNLSSESFPSDYFWHRRSHSLRRDYSRFDADHEDRNGQEEADAGLSGVSEEFAV
jgi:hypothetical protein